MFTTLQHVYGTYVIDAHPQRLKDLRVVPSKVCSWHVMENAAGYTSMGGYTRSRPRSSDGTTIQLILADDSSGHKSHRLDIGSSTTIKVLFNNFFSDHYDFHIVARPCFLGTVGNRTPQEVYTKDQAVTYVYPHCSSRNGQRQL